MEIDHQSATTQEKAGFFSCVKNKIAKAGRNIKKVGKDDPRRVIHSLKVGLALTFVSLLYYWRPLYDGFGVSGIWAVLTVVVVFEYSVGATLGKGINRGCATLSAGALGVGALHLATLFGRDGQPFVLGILVFLLATAATFTRFFPRIKARYEYGIVIFILTFSMITVSGYRVENLLEMANQRLFTILIGGATCIIISISVCPVWAGQDLHNLIANNLDKLANYLEGFGGEYFQVVEEGEMVKNDKSFLQGYKNLLNSKSTEESLANFAKWEPGHGRFLFRHPWKQYLKIGALARQCACQIEALNAHISTHKQEAPEFLRVIQESCTKMSSESGKALKELATTIKTMKHPGTPNQHLENSKNTIKDHKIALEAWPVEDEDLLAVISAATVASLLVEIVQTVEKISEAVYELAQMARFKKVEPTVSPEKPHLLHWGTVKPVSDGESNHVVITVLETTTDSLQNVNTQAQKPKEEV
ncbi:hypothetical protein UlMin_005396 [Ulmus minor]